MADLDALFGSSDSEDGGEEPQQRNENQQRQKDDLEDSDDEQPKARQQVNRQIARSGSGEDEDEDGAAGKGRANAGNPQGGAAEAPMVLHPVPDNTSVCLIRTTNVIAFQPRPFDPATFEVEEDTCLDASGKYRVPRPVEAVVRWRVRRLPDGSEARESNARFVRWEDGTLTLMLGSEVLDLPERDISDSNQYVFTVTGAGAPFQVSKQPPRRSDRAPGIVHSWQHQASFLPGSHGCGIPILSLIHAHGCYVAGSSSIDTPPRYAPSVIGQRAPQEGSGEPRAGQQ
jgi:hypothetical protein